LAGEVVVRGHISYMSMQLKYIGRIYDGSVTDVQTRPNELYIQRVNTPTLCQ
jgi:hypothetical protein